MKPTITLLLTILSLLSYGCVSPKSNYRPEATRISQPPLDAEATAYVGDEMLKQGKFFEQDAMLLSKPIKFGLISSYTLTPGYYLKVGEDRDSAFYMPEAGREGGSVIKSAITDPWQSIRLTKDGSKISVVTIFNLQVSEKATGVTMEKRLALSEDSFQQTLIYSGRVGNKINVGYREFSNNQARPAFNNDVEYDLAESKIIAYKGSRIEVIEATNEFIKYRVLRNFNFAEM